MQRLPSMELLNWAFHHNNLSLQLMENAEKQQARQSRGAHMQGHALKRDTTASSNMHTGEEKQRPTADNGPVLSYPQKDCKC